MSLEHSGAIRRSVKSLRRSVSIAALVLWSASAVNAAPITFTADLGPEVVGATGGGFVTVVYDGVAKTLSIDTTFFGLSGLTTVAHIHCCTALPGTGTAGVAVTPGTLPLFPAGLQAGSYSSGPLDLASTATYAANFLNNLGGGTADGAAAALLQGMYDGTAYFNIHSTTFGGGEIRGFLQVPEPASLLLLGTALTAFAVRRRRL